MDDLLEIGIPFLNISFVLNRHQPFILDDFEDKHLHKKLGILRIVLDHQRGVSQNNKIHGYGNKKITSIELNILLSLYLTLRSKNLLF